MDQDGNSAPSTEEQERRMRRERSCSFTGLRVSSGHQMLGTPSLLPAVEEEGGVSSLWSPGFFRRNLGLADGAVRFCMRRRSP